MKKIYLTLIPVLSVLQFTYAQWTNVSGTGNYYLNSGNVGIGLTTPASNLHVYEPLSDSKPGGTVASTKSIFRLSRIGTPSYSYNESAEFRIGHGGPTYWGSQLDLYINGPANTSNIPDQQVMTWLYNGNVGIGTTTPVSTLHLIGTFATSGTAANLGYSNALNTNFLANTGQVLIGWNRSYGAGETDFIANQGPGPVGGFAFYNHDNSNAETQLMWIMGTGNVLIGKSSQTNSAYKLDVAGNVRANSITVNVTGADFVFEPTYPLLSLSELKRYIDQNHHLPEIESAKQMQTDGLNLGDNQTKLLQKIEELTLYTITADKEIKDENAVIVQQQNQLKTQQEEIDQLKQQVRLLIKTINKK